MKSNYRRAKDGTVSKKIKCFTEEELTAYLEEQWASKEAEIYQAAIKDASAQILAVAFSTLYKPPYNWRTQRLMQFKRNIDATFQTMSTGILGKKFGTMECLEFMKNEIGIDFDEEVKKHG